MLRRAREIRQATDGPSSSADGNPTTPSGPSNAAASPEASFPQFTKLSSEIRNRIWGHFCPELTAAARFISFEIEEEIQEALDGNDFILFDHPDLLCQARQVTALLAVSREVRAFVKEVLPDTIEFRHRNYDFTNVTVHDDPRLISVIDGLYHYRKDTDIVWLDLPEKLDKFHFPLNINTFRLGEGVKEALNVGFKLPDGRFTLWDSMVKALALHLLKQFPKLQAFYYGIPADELVEASKDHYMDWCFFHLECHDYGFTWLRNTNNFDDGRDVIWRWPTPESITEELIPRVISKSVKPIESTAALLGWKMIPVFEFEDEFMYSDFAADADMVIDLPDLPEGSDMSEDELLGDEYDGFDDESEDHYHHHHHHECMHGIEPTNYICGSRPDPLTLELQEWGIQDREKGYQDSDAGDTEDESTMRTFTKFNELPIELRYRIWEIYCPEFTAPARVFEFDIGCFRSVMGPQDYKVYEGLTTRSVTRKIRKLLAINQESRNLGLKALPDKLDFRIPPHEEIMMKGDVSADPSSSLRFRKETDIIFLRQPPEWQWEEGPSQAEQAYSLQGFGNVVQNLAVMQPPQVILRDDHVVDIQHLLEQFSSLVNYYYIVPPHLANPRYMKWCLAPEATRHQHTMVPDKNITYDVPIEKELWCWLTKDAATKLKIPRRVEEMALRLRTLAKDKDVNLLPMTVISGRRDCDTYVGLVEAEEASRVRAEAGEPEEADSDEDGTHDNDEVPVEAIIGAIMDGTIPGGVGALSALLAQGGIDPHALDEAYEAFQETPWDDMMEDDEDSDWDDEEDD